MNGEIAAMLALVITNVALTGTALYLGLRIAGLKEELGEEKLAHQKSDEQTIQLSKDFSAYKKGCEEQKKILRKVAKDLEVELVRNDTPASVLDRLNGLFAKAKGGGDDEDSGVPAADSDTTATPDFEL